MKFCPECGSKLISDKMKFCSECGTSLMIYARPDAEEKSEVKSDAQKLPESSSEGNNIPQNVQENENIGATSVQAESETVEGQSEIEEKPEESEPKETSAGQSTVKIDFTPDDSESKKDEQPIEGESDDLQKIRENGDSSEGVACFTIKPEHSKNDFIRALWIKIARDKAPLDIFDSNYGDVKLVDEEIYERSFRTTVNYSASVGYDREEPYIAYETYYEDEPYITTEEYYDYNLKQKRTRQVTKYKRVAKQRQVTKYKTVTDWSAYSNSGAITLNSAVSNTGKYLDVFCYVESRKSMSEESKSNIEVTYDGVIAKSAREDAKKSNSRDLDQYVIDSLPGDRSKEISYSINEIRNATENITRVKKYTATISYKGKNIQTMPFLLEI